MFRAVRNDLGDRNIGQVLVWCLSDNARARRFYERLGGRTVAETTERVAGVPLGKVGYLFA